MQTKVFTTIAASAVLAMSAQAASPRTEPPHVFFVTKFNTLCTETVSHQCTSTFTLALDSHPSTNCTVKWNSADYQFCGVASPEQAYYAEIEKPEELNVKFVSSFPGNTDTILGSTSLKNQKSDFYFPSTGETQS